MGTSRGTSQVFAELEEDAAGQSGSKWLRYQATLEDTQWSSHQFCEHTICGQTQGTNRYESSYEKILKIPRLSTGSCSCCVVHWPHRLWDRMGRPGAVCFSWASVRSEYKHCPSAPNLSFLQLWCICVYLLQLGVSPLSCIMLHKAFPTTAFPSRNTESHLTQVLQWKLVGSSFVMASHGQHRWLNDSDRCGSCREVLRGIGEMLGRC